MPHTWPGLGELRGVPTAEAIPAFWEAAPARVCTAGTALCCLPRLRNHPKPPCFVIKSNPSGLDHGRLLFEIPLLEELGLAPGMGDSPSLPLSHRSQPSCLLSFVFLHFSRSRGEARARSAAFVQPELAAGCPRSATGPIWTSLHPPSHIRAARTPRTLRAGTGG